LVENISLGSHNNRVHIVIWNERYFKLTTADSDGKIVVWNGNWYKIFKGTMMVMDGNGMKR